MNPVHPLIYARVLTNRIAVAIIAPSRAIAVYLNILNDVIICKARHPDAIAMHVNIISTIMCAGVIACSLDRLLLSLRSRCTDDFSLGSSSSSQGVLSIARSFQSTTLH